MEISDLNAASFSEMLSEYFSDYALCSPTGETNFDWSGIYGFLSEYAGALITTDNLESFAMSLVDLLQEFDCDSKRMTLVITNLYYAFLRPTAVSEALSRPKSLATLRLTILCHFLRLDILYPIVFHHDLRTIGTIDEGDELFMYILVKYGECVVSLHENFHFYVYDAVAILSRFISYLETLKEKDEEYKEKSRENRRLIKGMAIMYVDYLLKGEELTRHISSTSTTTKLRSYPEIKRSYLMLKALDALTRKMINLDGVCNYVECLKWVFCIDPEPFITVIEIGELMKDVITKLKIRSDDYIRDYLDEDLRSLCEVFVEIFPESNNFFVKPRNLKHLCRCRIRNILSEKKDTLPILIEELPIKKHLKVYISCIES